MVEEIGLNDAQIAALRKGYTIYAGHRVEVVRGQFYISTDSGTKVTNDDRELIIISEEDLFSLELCEINTLSEDDTIVDIYYDNEDDWTFIEISRNDIESGHFYDGDGNDHLLNDDITEDGLAGTWNNYNTVLGVEEALEENTQATIDKVQSDVSENTEATDEDVRDALTYQFSYDWYGDTDLSIEEHVFEAYKQADDPMIRTQLHDILLQLGYDVETNEELVELD